MDTHGRPKLLSVAEVTAAMSLSRRSVEKLIKDGLLKSISVGRRRLIDERDLEQMIASLKGEQPMTSSTRPTTT